MYFLSIFCAYSINILCIFCVSNFITESGLESERIIIILSTLDKPFSLNNQTNLKKGRGRERVDRKEEVEEGKGRYR